MPPHELSHVPNVLKLYKRSTGNLDYNLLRRPRPNVHSIGQNPSCHDIEDLNRSIAQESEDQILVLSLARDTNSKFFAQTWIAQLIAHLAQRQGGLAVRDNYFSWTAASPLDRFTTNIDGVAALVYSSIFGQGRLENKRQEPAPSTLYETLKTRLKMTSSLEDAGQTRTFIAIDPDYSNPFEFSKSEGLFSSFQHLVRYVLATFDDKAGIKKQAEAALYNFIYEVFQNTIEHGRYAKDGQIIPGLRYLRIRTYIDNSIEKLSARATGFPELEDFVSRRNNRQRRFLELSVSDGGQGIVSHYVNCGSTSANNFEQRLAILHELVERQASSKAKVSGVGLGLPNAMRALSELKAFISLRTEEFWMYRDFSKPSEMEPTELLQPVSAAQQICRLSGTQFNVVIDFSA